MRYSDDAYDSTDSENDPLDGISNEEYRKMLDNPILLPIYYWQKITKITIFKDDPDIGSGTFYYGDSPFGSGNFIDKNGDLSQVRPTAEGGWKRECFQDGYKLIFREYENEQYMYVAGKIPYSQMMTE
jgi:hypothetical protein